MTRFSVGEGGIKLVSAEPLSSDTLTIRLNKATTLNNTPTRIRGVSQGETPICTSIVNGLDGTG